jgi:tyrosine-protein kinase Etk/Wzc
VSFPGSDACSEGDLVSGIMNQQQEEIGLQHYVEILWRRRWLICSVFLVVFALCAVWVTLTKTTYQAKSLVALKNQMYYRQNLLAFAPGSDTPEQSLYGDSWAKIINGRPFAEKVANAVVSGPNSRPLVPENVLGSIRAEFHEPDLIEITARNVDPNLAKLLANATAETFVEENVASLRANLLSYSDYALVQMERYQSLVSDAEGEIAQFKEGLGFVNIDDEINTLKNTIGAFEKEAAAVQTQIEIAEAHISEIRSFARLSAENNDSILVDGPQVEQLRQLQELLTSARLRYTDRHPSILNLEAQIHDIEVRLRKSLEASGIPLSPERYLSMRDDLADTEAQLADLRTARSSWDRQISEVRLRLSDFPEKKYHLDQLEGRVEEARTQYASWREKVDDANSQASTVRGNASVADYASVAVPSVAKSTNLALGFIVAALLGIGVGVVIEFADTTIRTPEEITRAVGLGYLGSIIRMKEPREVVFENGKGTGAVSEAYTKIYSNIKFTSVETPLRTLLVTSARKGEGKSTTLINLACAIAAAGKKVIVVDTDLRNPSLQRVLKTRFDVGVTSVIAGESSLDDALQPTAHPGLMILPAGPIPPNQSELIQSHAMKTLIDDLKSRCDMVIFDSPPTLLVADAMLLASELDGAIILSESGGVTRKEVQYVRDTLQVAKVRILGVILNKVPESTGGYYYNYYSYYNYYREPEDQRPESTGALGWIGRSVRSVGSKIGGRG